jgi:hypothetical protein
METSICDKKEKREDVRGFSLTADFGARAVTIAQKVGAPRSAIEWQPKWVGRHASPRTAWPIITGSKAHPP